MQHCSFATILNRFFLITLVVCGFCSAPLAQAQKSREELEAEKKANQQMLKQVQGILNKTSSQKKASLGQLNAINSQISVQNTQITLINQDLRLMTNEMATLQRAKANLDNKLTELKKEYGRMIYEAAKRNTYNNQLIFLFSSGTFNQFILRYKYLKAYTKARNHQVEQIMAVQEKIAGQQQLILAKQNQQKSALDVRISETTKLKGLQTKQNEVVSELSKEETRLRTELAEAQRANARLEASIRRMIEREIAERRARAERERKERAEREKAEREARRRAEPNKPAPEPEEEAVPAKDRVDFSGMSEEEVKLASSFSASQRKLPWPVRGFVSEKFGRHAHPVLKGISVDNNGVNIQTNSGEPVRAVYNGIVLDVNEIMGMGYLVAIQHGDYITIYAKLKSVSVSAGKRVSARDVVGVVATDSEGTSEMNFQVWKNTTKLNPESWLRGR